MQICGVDEAGRGPVIGPLVVASFSLPEDKLYLIESLKVKDSKKTFSKEKRRTLLGNCKSSWKIFF